MVLIALDNFVLLPKLLGWKTAYVQDQALGPGDHISCAISQIGTAALRITAVITYLSSTNHLEGTAPPAGSEPAEIAGPWQAAAGLVAAAHIESTQGQHGSCLNTEKCV